jgi:hypothetical protein
MGSGSSVNKYKDILSMVLLGNIAIALSPRDTESRLVFMPKWGLVATNPIGSIKSQIGLANSNFKD